MTATGQPATAATSYRCECVRVEFPVQDGCLCVLDDVAFEVRDGEFVSIMGPSGCGKTTLLRVLGGLLRPDPQSRVTCQGRPVEDPPDGVMMVFQNYSASLLPWRTVAKNVALGIEGRVPEDEQRERVTEALEMVGLADRAKDHPGQLSGGMQQRVQLARALAMRPSVLLMDEPFGALDAMTKAALEDELLRVHERTGATVIFVTHDVDEAVYLSDRVLVLQGSPATVAVEVEVGCPRPRDQLKTKESEEFLAARHRIFELVSGRGTSSVDA